MTDAATVAPAEIAEYLERGAILIDVRDADAFEREHIPGALHYSLATLEEAATTAAPDRSVTVICYCNGGTRGPKGAALLTSLGYQDARYVAGGLRAYMAMVEGQ